MNIGNKIYKKESCYNSLQWAKSEIETAPDGSVFLADIHEYTKGRQGRIWNTYPGQLLVTILLKPQNLQIVDNLVLRLSQLNMAISLGILESLLQYEVILKWPNDFILQGKKLGGIITQVVWQENKPQGIIFGLGINVNNMFKESDELFDIATSLKMVSDRKIDKDKLLDQLLGSINHYYKLWLDNKFEKIYTKYKKHQGYLNKKIMVHKSSGPLSTGLFLDVLENGNIILKHKNGVKEEIDFAVVEKFE